MEARCRDKQRDAAAEQALGGELERVIHLLHALGRPAAEAVAPPLRPARNLAALRPLLDLIENRLRDDDGTVAECLPALSALLDGSAVEVANEMSAAVDDLEYATALVHLARLRNMLEGVE